MIPEVSQELDFGVYFIRLLLHCRSLVYMSWFLQLIGNEYSSFSDVFLYVFWLYYENNNKQYPQGKSNILYLYNSVRKHN
jgi:hypothetical protein